MPTVDHPRSIVLVRHGETHYNVAVRQGRVFASRADAVAAGLLPDHRVPLNESGRAQSRRIGPVIESLGPYDIAFHSPYRRALETLELLLEHYTPSAREGLQVRSHLALRERDAGYILNMSADEVRVSFPWFLDYELRTGPFYARPPGGESIADVYHRAHGFYASLRRARPGQSVLVVAHNRVIFCMRCILEKQTVAQMEAALESGEAQVENAQVLAYSFDPRRGRYVGRLGDRDGTAESGE